MRRHLRYLPGLIGALLVVAGLALLGLPLGLLGSGAVGPGLAVIGVPFAAVALGVFLLLVDRRVG